MNKASIQQVVFGLPIKISHCIRHGTKEVLFTHWERFKITEVHFLLWIEHEERGLEEATRLIKEAIHISDEETTSSPLIYERIDHQSAQIYQPLR